MPNLSEFLRVVLEILSFTSKRTRFDNTLFSSFHGTDVWRQRQVKPKLGTRFRRNWVFLSEAQVKPNRE